MCTDLFTPKEIASDLLYLSGIRDGFIGLGLCPGDIFAAPGFNDGLTQPSFALAVLMNGATCLHISMTDITKDPNLLTIYPLKVLGICSQLRDILMEHPVRKVRIWDSWFRDPTDSSDMHVWDMFIKKLELTDIPAGCMVWNSAMGGGLLFSRRRKGQALQNVLPLPGRKWQLTMMADDTTEALGGLGHFCVAASLGKDEEVYLPTPCILMDTFLEKIFLNLTIPVRKGIYYPKKFITEVVRKIDDCKDAVIVEIQNTGNTATFEFHLLIFCGTKKSIHPADIIKKINDTIQSQIGKAFFVDNIYLFPLFPRRAENNTIDEDWCCLQYLNGGLNRKSKDELFLGLSGIRAHVFEH
ncbi:MAG: hypothetical protein KKE61_07650, partial [Proteobacteria bacterium]|nr:hypothetical protein [Pseudomonadota bacterium]